MKLSACLFVVGAIVACATATLSELKTDAAGVLTQSARLAGAVNSFPSKGATVKDAIAIRDAFDALEKQLENGYNHAKDTPPFSQADSKAMLNSFSGVETQVNRALDDLVKKKSAFEDMHVPGIKELIVVKLKELNDNVEKFENALINLDTKDTKGQGIQIRDKLAALFRSAIAAFNN